MDLAKKHTKIVVFQVENSSFVVVVRNFHPLPPRRTRESELHELYSVQKPLGTSKVGAQVVGSGRERRKDAKKWGRRVTISPPKTMVLQQIHGFP